MYDNEIFGKKNRGYERIAAVDLSQGCVRAAFRKKISMADHIVPVTRKRSQDCLDIN